MKILIMGFTKIKYMPYMKFYLDNMDRNKNEIHLLYWNRDLQDENVSDYSGIILHEFRCYQEDDVSKLSKINSFRKYRIFANEILKRNSYDFVFVLHSLTGVLVNDTLSKYYLNKYIFDYRDSTYEALGFFKKVIAKLTRGSRATFVSSDAFRRFLPEDCRTKIYTSHNILEDSLKHRDEKNMYGISSEKIRISFWGFIRHEEINKEIIKKISLDDRFELHYYGREQQVAMNLKDYAEFIQAENVFFHGEYKPEDRYKFIRETDLIHNIYCDKNTMLAMGNKFYDGVIFRIPQLCMKNSFMGKCISENEVGLECNPYDSDFMDRIYDYYVKLQKDTFYNNVESVYAKILKEYNEGAQYIRNLIEREEE